MVGPIGVELRLPIVRKNDWDPSLNASVEKQKNALYQARRSSQKFWKRFDHRQKAPSAWVRGNGEFKYIEALGIAL